MKKGQLTLFVVQVALLSVMILTGENLLLVPILMLTIASFGLPKD